MTKPVDDISILITGGSGFVGSRLIARLREEWPQARIHSPDTAEGAEGFDVRDLERVRAAISQAKPDVIVHLAAVSAVTSALKDPRLAFDVNASGTLNMLIATEELAPDGHFVFASSSEVYGRSFQHSSFLDENGLLNPTNPYAAAKASADLLVQEFGNRSLNVSILRLFNHTGPGQTDRFVMPAFASQIARIERGEQEPVMRVGGLEDGRDFLDVRDVLEAYVAAIRAGHRRQVPACSIMNIASGTAYRIGDLLQKLLEMSDASIETRQDPSRMRPGPPLIVSGDAKRARESLGWTPAIAIEQTLRDTLDYWRSQSLANS